MGKQRSRTRSQIVAGLTLILLVPSCWAGSSGPDCSAIEHWPTQMSEVRLADFGYQPNQIDETKTKTNLLATMPVKGEPGEGVIYKQVYRITFVTKSGEPINVITTTLANDDECSVGMVSISLISKELTN
ncbi:hypothetical protein [Buttiauxella agrestis]|uniref:hypothetical protein n=1 Tax=Buttiauxella agrestis TaxID=82977 RepID=UPI003974C7F1